ncbi:MAG TPA: dockerin type I domain-containing protein [Tepidisphaeraceae bacterium]|jgi:autotransporter-associated beta strand protein
MSNRRILTVLFGACAAVGFGQSRASAQIVVDGTLDAAYGTPLATQTINSSYGDNTTPSVDDSTGSELDAIYSTVQNNTLYIMLTGDIQNNGNLLNLFIDDGRGGSNPLNAASGNGGHLPSMNGSIFSSGFNPTYEIDANDYQGTFYTNTYSLYNNLPANYIGADPLTKGIGSATLDTVQVGVNNTNIGGVVGNTTAQDGSTVIGAAADQTAADAVTTGIEFGIPLSLLGNPTGQIKIMADINGGSDSGPSNQFLPGLAVGTPSVKTGNNPYYLTATSFTFADTPTEYVTVVAPSVPGNWISSSGGSWSTSVNWSNGSVPNAPGAAANFTNAAGGNVTVDGPFTVGSMSFNTPTTSVYTLEPDSNNDPVTFSNTSGDATITDFGGAHIIAVPFVLTSKTDVSIANNGDILYFANDISGPGALSSTNPGGGNGSMLVLLGTNTYTGGTILNSGLIQLESSTALPANSALTFNASDVPDPTLDVDGNDITVSSISTTTGVTTAGTGAIGQIINTSGSNTLTYAGDPSNPSTFYGVIRGSSGGAMSLVVASGSLTINGSSQNTNNPVPASYTGSTTINTGATLTLSATSHQYTDANNVVQTIVGGNTLSQTSSITNNGTLNINDFESVPQITNNGTINVGAGGDMQLRPGAGNQTYASAGLMLNGGTIDIDANTLTLTYTSGNDPAAAIRADMAAGEIINSAGTTPGTAVGYADGSVDTTSTIATGNELVFKYTWLGDLDLDGVVTSADLGVLDAHLGSTNADWAEGDLNYDGKVNGDDLSLLMLGAAESNGVNISSVPEPATMALLAIPLLGIRRRKQA